MVAPPAHGGGSARPSRHPVDALVLAERCVSTMQLQPSFIEGQMLLPQISRALRMLPWNRRALTSAQRLKVAVTEGDAALLSACSHLAPHLDEAASVESLPLGLVPSQRRTAPSA